MNDILNSGLVRKIDTRRRTNFQAVTNFQITRSAQVVAGIGDPGSAIFFPAGVTDPGYRIGSLIFIDAVLAWSDEQQAYQQNRHFQRR